MTGSGLRASSACRLWKAQTVQPIASSMRDRGAQVALGVVVAAEQRGEAAELAVDRAVADDGAARGRGPAGVGERAGRRGPRRASRRRARRSPRRTRPCADSQLASNARSRRTGSASSVRARLAHRARRRRASRRRRTRRPGPAGELAILSSRKSRSTRSNSRRSSCAMNLDHRRRTARRCGRPARSPAAARLAAQPLRLREAPGEHRVDRGPQRRVPLEGGQAQLVGEPRVAARPPRATRACRRARRGR